MLGLCGVQSLVCGLQISQQGYSLRLPRPQGIVTRRVTVSYSMVDSRILECFAGAWSLDLVVVPVLIAFLSIQHGPTSRLNVEV